MICDLDQDLSGSRCIKGINESMIRVDSSVPLMHHDPDRSWITDLYPDHSTNERILGLGVGNEEKAF